MDRLFHKNEIRFLDPPTEEQWKSIWQKMNDKNWLMQSAWPWFGVMAKLSYAKAVVSADGLGEINGVLIFANPSNIHISFIARYAVDEKCRGQGLGRKMWTLMEQLTDSSRIRVINSDDDMTMKYRASGFPVSGETFKKIRGNVLQLKVALQEAISARTKEKASIDQVRKIPSEVTIEQIAEFDRTIMPFDRSAFLNAFFTFADGRAIIRSIEGKEAVVAYGGTNPGFDENDLRIGPIYATNFDDVILLLHALLVDSVKSNYDLGFSFDNESSHRLVGFLCGKAGAMVGEKQLSRSYSRPLDFNIDWSKVFVVSGHFTALQT